MSTKILVLAFQIGVAIAVLAGRYDVASFLLLESILFVICANKEPDDG